jgi:hypothetical protein
MTFVRSGWNWYVAQLVLESKVQDEPRPIVQIESILLHAESPNAAYEKATELCASPEHAYRNSSGVPVRQSYIGIHDIDNLQVEAPHDGLTLSVQRLDEMCGIDAITLAHSREELTLFRGKSKPRTNLDQ